MLTVSLPWPPSVLSPNSRAHWAQKAKAAKACRERAFFLTKRVKLNPLDCVMPDLSKPLVFRITIRAPDNRRRDDDNIVAMFKSSRDGIADALGIDDNKFELRVRRGPNVDGGLIVVDIFNISDTD